jgi:translation initiation factor IF-2
MPKTETQTNTLPRPPIVVVMGHVDHGKSTLLDYIRKTNVVAGEAGSITQHISAYEVSHKDEHKVDCKITFLDTPGHEAFSKMRERGSRASDIAILVVSAEDSVKTQTLEAYKTIIENKIPYIVAINKIDKPNANIEKTKLDLVEKEIYLEGMGGDIPFVLISAKTGQGIDDLLDIILLVSQMQANTGDTNLPASGVIIETNREPKRGISATCIIQNGTLKGGMFVVSGDSYVNTRMMENFQGQNIKEATFSSPIRLVGFKSMPEIGASFVSFQTMKEVEKYIESKETENQNTNEKEKFAAKCKIIPLILKTDVSGTLEAIEKAVSNLNTPELSFKIISKSVGGVNESDIKMGAVNKESIILAFNTKIDNEALNLNENLKVQVEKFNIIYKLTEFLETVVLERRPKVDTIETTGQLKVLKTFGATKDRQVVGGKVITGRITDNSMVRIIRRDFEIGQGKVVGLQLAKSKAKEVSEGTDCGVQIESKIDIAQGDVLEVFIITAI